MKAMPQLTLANKIWVESVDVHHHVYDEHHFLYLLSSSSTPDGKEPPTRMVAV